MPRSSSLALEIVLLGSLLSGCTGERFGCTTAQSATDLRLAGGIAATVADESSGAFSLPAPVLDRAQERAFFKGRALFRDIWVTAPASAESRDGLGPLFNARSCEGCHVRDGRGRPPLADEPMTTMLLRLSLAGEQASDGGPQPEPTYGGQFQPLAVEGVPSEGEVKIRYEAVNGRYPDGSPYSLRRPSYEFTHLSYGPMHPRTLTSPRVAASMIGLGLLDAVPEQTLLAAADPEDRDRNGISGRANFVWNVREGRKTMGRFGWKANKPTIEQQVAGAFLGDIGITSELFSTEDCTSAQADCAKSNGDDPELESSILESVTFYSKTLAVPARRQVEDDVVARGESLFGDIGCADCHTPKLTTGDYPDVPAYANQEIQAFTDLLLHDMGEDLADHRPDFEASGTEWRTPPLWGIGLVETVNEHSFFLHDGRARTLEEAVLWHGGEGQAAKTRFMELERDDREALLKFLGSL